MRVDPDAPCFIIDYTGRFFNPSADNLYAPGETIELSWFGGKIPEINTGVKYNVFLHSNQSYSTNITVLDNYIFRFGYGDGSKSWLYSDDCGNTKLYYDWTIPVDMDITDHLFSFTAINAAANTLLQSEAFRIQLKNTVSSSMSASGSGPSPTAQDSTQTNGSIIPSPSSSPTTNLSGGAKAGIGAGAVAIVGILMLVLWIFWRKKKKQHTKVVQVLPPENRAAGHEKPEVDAMTIERRAMESGGAELHEIGS